MIDEVHLRIWGDDNNVVSAPPGNASSSIYESSTGNVAFGAAFSCNSAMRLQIMRLSTTLMDFYAEYMRDQNTYRCHPAFLSDNPIYENTMMQETSSRRDPLPSECIN